MKNRNRIFPLIALGFLLGAVTPAMAQVKALPGPQEVRIEHDLLGEKAIPSDAYYGVQTARALENFQISGRTISDYPEFIKAYAQVKMAAAMANTEVGKMKPEVRDAILAAGRAILEGKFLDQFPVDPFQGGAGTSTNMNVNEVMANIALELEGRSLGDYESISPNDDVNMSQSTNDSYPTAIKVAIVSNNGDVVMEARRMAASLRAKGEEFLDIVKMGRTEMQDAVPMTVGQEFYAFSAVLEGNIRRLLQAEKDLYAINMGGTAIGTGLNAPEGYTEKCAAHLAELTGKDYAPAKDLIGATWDQSAFVSYSSALKELAVSLSKISDDLILLTSGPRAGLFEIKLPALQPGSSIMPGKVNPVAPELVNLVAFRVMGNDLTVTLAAHHGQLQLNAYEPVEAVAIFESQQLLGKAMSMLRTKCIDGITVNRNILKNYMDRTVGIVTALNPVIGHAKGDELAKEAYETDKGLLELVREQKLLSEEQIRDLLDPEKLTGLKRENYKSGN